VGHQWATIFVISQHNKGVLGLFSLRMRRNAYLRASGQKSDDDPISSNREIINSSVGIHFRYVLAISLVRMCRNSVNPASGLKTALTIVFSDHDFL